MNTPTRVGVVLGTRPEAIKLAPVVSALRRHARFEPILLSTGQHRHLIEPVLADFGLVADVDLALGAEGQGLPDLAGRALSRIGAALTETGADLVIVQGDTTTALAGALAGFYQRLPVAHVEAGLRTDDRLSPFPEEVNRRMVTQAADLHFAPTARAADRLLADGVRAERVVMTGNTVVDALFATIARDLPYRGVDAQRLAAIDDDAPVLLVTAHRRESWDGGIGAIASAVRRIVAEHPAVQVVFPLHPNPIVRDAVRLHLADVDRVLLVESLGYSDFVRVLRRATIVLTDSGGIQEEACSIGIPTLVARDTTEREEGAEAGGLRLVGTDADDIVFHVSALLRDPIARAALSCRDLPFGDGHAADRIIDSLALIAPDKNSTHLEGKSCLSSPPSPAHPSDDGSPLPLSSSPWDSVSPPARSVTTATR